MRRYRRRWYERFGIEHPFPWVLIALLPLSAVCAATAHARWWASHAE